MAWHCRVSLLSRPHSPLFTPRPLSQHSMRDGRAILRSPSCLHRCVRAERRGPWQLGVLRYSERKTNCEPSCQRYCRFLRLPPSTLPLHKATSVAWSSFERASISSMQAGRPPAILGAATNDRQRLTCDLRRRLRHGHTSRPLSSPSSTTTDSIAVGEECQRTIHAETTHELTAMASSSSRLSSVVVITCAGGMGLTIARRLLSGRLVLLAQATLNKVKARLAENSMSSRLTSSTSPIPPLALPLLMLQPTPAASQSSCTPPASHRPRRSSRECSRSTSWTPRSSSTPPTPFSRQAGA